MGDKSDIEWTDATWNPVTGCDKVSQGCKYCYAEQVALSMMKSGHDKYAKGFQVRTHEYDEDLMTQPLRWQKPRRVFVNSMSDLFHRDVSDQFIIDIFDIMRRADRHIFQVLTKRPERVTQMLQDGLIPWPPNVWLGTSVESDEVRHKRMKHLEYWKATVDDDRIAFVSFEPLIARVTNVGDYTRYFDWAIVGGENGKHHRPIRKEWVEEICREVKDAGLAFFFKQWAGKNRREIKAKGRELNGVVWTEFPGPVVANEQESLF